MFGLLMSTKYIPFESGDYLLVLKDNIEIIIVQ